MARLSNARKTHMTRWVIPAATRLLIDSACTNAPTQSLENVAHIEMGQSPNGDSCNEHGEGVPLIGGPADLGLVFPKTSRWTSAPTKLCRSGDIIVCVRATIGEPRWANNIYCLGRGVAAIRPIDDSLDASFLFRIIEGNEQSLSEQGTGTTFKTIGKKHLSAILVPTIPPQQQKAISSFLHWLEESSNGRPNFSLAPPLPQSLNEQLHLVARIEDLASKVAEARRLQKEVSGQMDALCRALITDPPDGMLTPTVMNDLLVMREPDVKVEATNSYHFAGVYCFGRGVFAGQRKDGSEFAYRTLTKIQKGNFVYPKLMAWEGALGVVPEKCDGLYVSPEFPVFEVREDRVLPDVLDTYFRMPSVWPDLASISTGTNVRRRRLHPRAFLRYKFPLPSMKVQRQFCAVKLTIEHAKREQSESAAELEALMPSILSKAFSGEL